MSLYILSILVLWFIIVVIMISDWKSRINRWLAITLFIASFVGIGDIFIDLSKTITSDKSQILLNIGTFFFISSCTFYYALLNYSFYSSHLFFENKLLYHYFPILTLIPVIIIFALCPKFSIEFDISMISLIVWKNVYSFIIYYFLTAALFANKNRMEKVYHLKVFLFVVPTLMFTHILNDYAFFLGDTELHKKDFWIIVYVVAVYIFFLIKDGFMGMSIKIEKTRLQGNVETLNMTTVFLTHDFKNELVKISEFIKKVKRNIDYKDNEDLNKWFTHIDSSKTKLEKMIEKIKSASNESIILNNQRHSLPELISKAINNTTYGDRQISIIKTEICKTVDVLCDIEYTTKAIANLIDNAFEAINGNGEIKVKSSVFDRFCVIEIQDNGSGISKENLEHIMKPFFSTKASGSNMGLGLTYCYNIITMSGGKINIQSKQGKGTTVKIYIEKA